jgi:hypothetical protein
LNIFIVDDAYWRCVYRKNNKDERGGEKIKSNKLTSSAQKARTNPTDVITRPAKKKEKYKKKKNVFCVGRDVSRFFFQHPATLKYKRRKEESEEDETFFFFL